MRKFDVRACMCVKFRWLHLINILEFSFIDSFGYFRSMNQWTDARNEKNRSVLKPKNQWINIEKTVKFQTPNFSQIDFSRWNFLMPLMCVCVCVCWKSELMLLNLMMITLAVSRRIKWERCLISMFCRWIWWILI